MAAFTSENNGDWDQPGTWAVGSVAGIVDDADGGFSSVGGWSSGGGRHYFLGPDAGAIASWAFTGLTPSAPIVACLNWDAHVLHAPAAPWQVIDSDGTTVLASGTVDQTVDPATGYFGGGLDFEPLATVTPSGTTLTLKLSAASAGYAIANSAGIGTPGGSTTPGIGDTATDETDVSVDDDVTVGTSPSNDDDYVVTVSPFASLTIEADVTLEVRGAINLDANVVSGVASFTMEEGSVLEFDSSAATGTPAYLFSCGGGTATLTANGVPANRVTIRSNVGGGNAIITDSAGSGPGRPNLNLNYADVSLEFDSISDQLLLDHCNLTGGGVLGFYDSSSDIDVRDCFFTGGSGWSFAGTFAVTGGTTRNWFRNSFADNLQMKMTAATIIDNYFGGGVGDVSNGQWATLDRNFISADDFPLVASASRLSILTDHNLGNPHSVLPSSGVTLSRSVIDYSGNTFGIDAGNSFYAPSSTGCTFSENIVGPNAHGLGANGAVTFAAAGGCDVYKSALYSAQYSGGILLGDGTGTTGTYPNVKGNIFWVGLSDGFTGLAAYAIDTTTDNIITPAGCTHNLCINLAATRYQGDYPTTQPGASDTVVTGVDVHTILHSPYRDIATWAVERGSIAVGYDAQKADALAYLAADPSLNLAHLTHRWGGVAIINPSYKGLAHDGFDHGPAWRPLPLEPATADGDEVTFADWNHTLDTGVVPDPADFVFGSGRTCSGVTVNAGSVVLTGVSPVYDGSVAGDYVTYVPGADPITGDDTSESEMWAGTVNDLTSGGSSGGRRRRVLLCGSAA